LVQSYVAQLRRQRCPLVSHMQSGSAEQGPAVPYLIPHAATHRGVVVVVLSSWHREAPVHAEAFIASHATTHWPLKNEQPALLWHSVWVAAAPQFFLHDCELVSYTHPGTPAHADEPFTYWHREEHVARLLLHSQTSEFALHSDEVVMRPHFSMHVDATGFTWQRESCVHAVRSVGYASEQDFWHIVFTHSHELIAEQLGCEVTLHPAWHVSRLSFHWHTPLVAHEPLSPYRIEHLMLHELLYHMQAPFAAHTSELVMVVHMREHDPLDGSQMQLASAWHAGREVYLYEHFSAHVGFRLHA